MECFNVLKAMNIRNDQFMIHLNTASILDYATGTMIDDGLGHMIMNGGVPPISGVSGRGGMFKSTTFRGLISRLLHIYEGSQAVEYETENNLTSADRYMDVSDPNYPISPDNIGFISSNDMDLPEYTEQLRAIGEERLKYKKDLMVETPFRDPKNPGSYLRMMVPFFAAIDSITLAKSSAENVSVEKEGIDSDKMNMLFMRDGIKKTLFMRQLPGMVSKYGFYVFITAQVGNKFDMNPMAPTQKQLVHMKQQDKMKGVGAQFEYLTNLLIQTMSVSNLVYKAKDKSSKETSECMFPYVHSALTELNQVDMSVIRSKNGGSGLKLPFVVSQYAGLQSDLTNYMYIKNNQYGIEGTTNLKCKLYPSESFTRRNLRETLNGSYELRRAIEILAGYCYIKNNWPAFKFTQNLQMSAEELCEKLINNKTVPVSDVLNSRGYWTYKKDERPYLSIFDILHILNN